MTTPSSTIAPPADPRAHPSSAGPLRLRAAVQHYHWGSHSLISDLRGQPPSRQPEAEYWFGDHLRGDTLVEIPGESGGPTSLRTAIAEDPTWWLGDQREELPFLLKLLAADRPLSIQVHPSRQQAEDGFAREEEAGIAADAPERSYRDRSDKPEILRALSPFVALYGFRPRTVIREALALLGLAAELPGDTVREMITHLALLDQQQRRRLAERAADAASRHTNHPDWSLACHWVGELAKLYPEDPWVLAPILLQLVELAPGEALFTEAGVPHAYLHGLGVELMNSSDNVLRAGLTSKKVDAAELIRVFDSRAVQPDKLRPEPVTKAPNGTDRCPGLGRYRTPTGQFELLQFECDGESAIDLGSGIRPGSPGIVLCARGRFTLRSGEVGVELAPTEAAFVPAASGSCRLEGSGLAFVAALPSAD